jgi:hypothetical protein
MVSFSQCIKLYKKKKPNGFYLESAKIILL